MYLCGMYAQLCALIQHSLWIGIDLSADKNCEQQHCDFFAIFVVKLTIDMLTVRGQQRSFSIHKRMF